VSWKLAVKTNVCILQISAVTTQCYVSTASLMWPLGLVVIHSVSNNVVSWWKVCG